VLVGGLGVPAAVLAGVFIGMLTELHATGQTIVLVTHDEQLAQAYATRTIRLTDGHLTTDTAGPVGVARNATGATAGVPR